MKERVARLIALLRSAMYPHIFGTSSRRGSAASAIAVSYNLQSAAELLEQILTTLQPERTEEETDTLILRFLEQIPEIKACLETDIQAAYDGDPAAMSCDEIMLAYPAFEAISIYRMAHRLYKMGIPMLPRMMTEYAHQLTGIDIHPGATIGNYFFIDHGTGVVIGETTTIGEHVKLYQGVTLGAKSFELDEHGNPVKGIKRHPDIGNHVVVADYQGYVHFLDKSNGEIVARVKSGGTRVSNPPVVAGDTVIVINDDGRISAFRPKA